MNRRAWGAALLAMIAVTAMATMWAQSERRPVTLAAGGAVSGAAVPASPSPSARPGITVPGSRTSSGPGPSTSTSPTAAPGQPNQPVLPNLMPAQCRRIVVFSWDGAGEDSNRVFSKTRAVALANDASMTYFLSGIYALPESRRMAYYPPGHPRGASAIAFLTDSQIALTMQQVRLAWLDGSEIGTHFNGHFCASSGGSSWTVQDWASELRQAKEFVANWQTNNGLTSSPPLPFDVNREIVGGRAPCLEGQASLMPAEVAAGFRYDASSPGGRQVWPSKMDGLWNFPLEALPVPGMTYEVLSMDYNFMTNQSTVTQGDPARCSHWRKQAYDGFVGGFSRASRTNRAPLFIGNHFEGWNRGIYMQAVQDTVRTVCSKPAVYCVSFRQLADWMDRQKPARLAALRTLDVGQHADWAAC